MLELGTLSHFVALVCHVLLYTFVTFSCTHLSHIVVLGCHTCLSRSVVLVCHTCFGLLYLEQGGSRHFGAIVAIGKLRLVATTSRFSLDLQSDKKGVGIAPPALTRPNDHVYRMKKTKVFGIAPPSLGS